VTGGFPRYSTDIAAAWEVVEKLTADHEFRFQADYYGPFVQFIRYAEDKNGDHPDYSSSADTAPHAICLAALKAVGVEV
jgi:hypothetical protein